MELTQQNHRNGATLFREPIKPSESTPLQKGITLPSPLIELAEEGGVRLTAEARDWLEKTMQLDFPVDPPASNQLRVGQGNSREVVATIKAAAHSYANPSGVATVRKYLQEQVSSLLSRGRSMKSELAELEQLRTLTKRNRRVKVNAQPRTECVFAASKAVWWLVVLVTAIVAEILIARFNVVRSGISEGSFLAELAMFVMPVACTVTMASALGFADIEKHGKKSRSYLAIAFAITIAALFLLAHKLGTSTDIDYSSQDQPWQTPLVIVVFGLQIAFAIAVYLSGRFLEDAVWESIGYRLEVTKEYEMLRQQIDMKMRALSSIEAPLILLNARLKGIEEQSRECQERFSATRAEQEKMAEAKAKFAEAKAQLARQEALLGCVGVFFFVVSSSNLLAQTPQAEKAEYFVLLCKQNHSDLNQAFKREVFRFLASAETGGIAHIAKGDQHQYLATLEFVKGDGPARFRNKTWKEALPAVHGAFDQVNREHEKGQVNLPLLPQTIERLRRTNLPARIVIFGDPLYVNPRHKGFSHEGGFVTTDASIGAELTPFRLAPSLPKGSKVNWIVPSPTFGVDEEHQYAVTRFNRLYIQRLQSRLLRTTIDPKLAFSFLDDNTPVVEPVEGQPGRREVSFQTVSIEKSKGLATLQMATAEISRQFQGHEDGPEAVLMGAERQKDRIALAINYFSEDPLCDVDLCIASDGLEGEINFLTPERSWGRLYRDLRKADTSREPFDDAQYKNWEWASIDHARLNDLSLWLNVYQTTKPVRVTVVRVWQGDRKTLVYDFDLSSGDGGANRNNRSASPCWKRIPLYAPGIEPR